MIRIGLLGASGRMGQWLEKLLTSDYASLAQLGARPARGEALDPLLGGDAVIDFSSAEASVALAERALAHQGKLPVFVIGSTGWKGDQMKNLERLAQKTPVLVSSNFSTGVLALQQILKTYAPVLARLGYTPVMIEAHHRHKKDAPSGTAIMLNRTIQSAAGISEVQTHSVRAGEVIGDHEVTFYGPADRISLGHFAQDRSIFARGAIDAALWLHQRRAELASEKVILSMDRYLRELVSE